MDKKSKYDYNYVSQRKNEKYKNELKKYIVENPNTVYISSQEPIYQTLYNIAQQNNMTLDDYIQLLGYTRSKGRNSLIELSEEINKILSVENEKIEKKISSDEKIKRNHLLINRLKEFYSYECQLCTENQKMIIQKEDGTKYVEVHHIKNLSEEYDEEGTLDRLNNLIVVCPNHHKMLHYHNGGYRKIEKTNNVLAFTNESSDIIPIVHNKHLTSNE
jgi:predicted HNH restriction endonuclease